MTAAPTLPSVEVSVARKIAKRVRLCPKCKKKPREKSHVCPYASDIKGDQNTKCQCCATCQKDCAADI